MLFTTLCYIEKDGKYLMLHRTKKEKDISQDKWLGVGGKFEAGESPEECMIREVKEETGLTLNSYRLRGIVTYVSTVFGIEYMYVFTSDDFVGELLECNEGELEWIEKEKIFDLNMWEGDKIFLKELNGDKFFSIKMEYDGDKLIKHKINKY